MYIIVDSNLCDAVMKKRRLLDNVYDFFEEFVKTSKVFLVSRVSDAERVKYDRLRTQLPESVKEYREITISSEPKPEESLQDEPTEEVPVFSTEQGEKYLQIGSRCKMTIEKARQQFIAIHQDGTQNIVNVKIVPNESTSKVIVVITTDPKDSNLEKLLLREIKGNKEIINIRLQDLDGFIVDIREGSIVIEIDVDPNRVMESEWIENVMRAVFQEKVVSRIPKGTLLRLDVDINKNVPVHDLQNHFAGIQKELHEDLHKNCVDSEKYEEVLKELEDLKHRLNVVTVSVVSGDITKETSGVIVNTTNPKLNLSDGAVSGHILDAAGSTIQKECVRMHPSGVKVGHVAVTGGGNLECKNIYHITLSDRWISNQSNTEQCLRDVLIKCLQKADAYGHKSISIPALGTGRLKYDPKRVAEIMYDVCLNFNASGLREVRLVVHPSRSHVHSIFSEVEERHRKQFGRSLSLPATSTYAIESKQPSSTNIPKSHSQDFIPARKLTVNWIKGNIAKQQVDAVVNSTVNDLDLSSGTLSKAILAAAGDEIQAECTANYPDGIKPGEIAHTSGGRMWSHIFHTTLWPWGYPQLKQNYKELICDCLERAKNLNISSIAFPLLGTGVLQYPPREAATWIAEAVQEFDKGHANLNLHEVNIVVHPQDDKSVEALCHLGKLPTKSASHGHLIEATQFY